MNGLPLTSNALNIVVTKTPEELQREIKAKRQPYLKQGKTLKGLKGLKHFKDVFIQSSRDTTGGSFYHLNFDRSRAGEKDHSNLREGVISNEETSDEWVVVSRCPDEDENEVPSWDKSGVQYSEAEKIAMRSSNTEFGKWNSVMEAFFTVLFSLILDFVSFEKLPTFSTAS